MNLEKVAKRKKSKNMIAWGHEIIEFGEKESEDLIGLDIVACQIAEAGAMGYHGGVFLVSSSGKVYFTCLMKPSDYTGNRKHTPRHILEQVFPPLMECESGLMGRGVSAPEGFMHEYLGMGNHLLVKNCISEEFRKLASVRLKEHPDAILYNLWMDIVCDVLKKNHS